MKAQIRPGGRAFPDYKLRRRVSEDEWEELTAERPTPSKGRGVPANIIRNPIVLPEMRNIKDGGE
jgi:hypothetical protein